MRRLSVSRQLIAIRVSALPPTAGSARAVAGAVQPKSIRVVPSATVAAAALAVPCYPGRLSESLRVSESQVVSRAVSPGIRVAPRGRGGRCPCQTGFGRATGRAAPVLEDSDR